MNVNKIMEKMISTSELLRHVMFVTINHCDSYLGLKCADKCEFFTHRLECVQRSTQMVYLK